MNKSGVIYAADGMPIGADKAVDEHGYAFIDEGKIHHGVELQSGSLGWFSAESNRNEQQEIAHQHFHALCEAVVRYHHAGLCPDGKWTNDPTVFPLPHNLIVGRIMDRGVVPFPPNDLQFFCTDSVKKDESLMKSSPNVFPNEDGLSTWVRLTDFCSNPRACHVFDDTRVNPTHYGRVLQGALDTGYLVEALQAIAMRPKLARSLFYCWDTNLSVYIVRLYKNGTWMRVELDDFVPARSLPVTMRGNRTAPICCRSEHFPMVLWPSLVEKAYAKIHTVRTTDGVGDQGGWEVIGGGGRLEDALTDLTGGVAGRFLTRNISADRLFVYLHELQRDCLFVCRVDEARCDANGVYLNPYFPHVVHRAVVFEGRPYIQVFCGAPALDDGGLQDIGVPWTLVNSEEYPEKGKDGFFWCQADDFAFYFGTIFECRLTNSGDVSIPGMPPPRMPANMGPLSSLFGLNGPAQNFFLQMQRKARFNPQHLSPEGLPLPFFEWVFADGGKITRDNQPEFSIQVPEFCVPCEVICSLDQVDLRFQSRAADKPQAIAILLKVYENVQGNRFYSNELVCKSNWLPIRNSMVAFQAMRGAEFKIVAELPDRFASCNKLVFRCYVNQPGVQVTAVSAWSRHLLVNPIEPPKASKWTFVGAAEPLDILRDRPDPFEEELDGLRQPAMDTGCCMM